jgi:hypothetical protein
MSKVIFAAGGITLVVLVWLSVVRTTFIPGHRSSRAARWTARACAAVLSGAARRLPPRPRERLMELCAPVSLLLVPAEWLFGLALGFALVAAGTEPTRALVAVGMLCAALVLAVYVAHLTGFLAAYTCRERMVVRSATRVHRITDADELLAAYLRRGSRDNLDSQFARWTDWLVDIQTSHAGYPALLYQRSVGGLCWPTAALVVLDIAALVEAVAPQWAPWHTQVLLNAGSTCLQRSAGQLGIVPPPMLISLHGREERAFDDTMRLAASAGLPPERDVDQARAVFQTIRVRYAPYAVLIRSRLLSPCHNEQIGQPG